jgi:glycosyltransferase involved in cell wall biosynthesis
LLVEGLLKPKDCATRAPSIAQMNRRIAVIIPAYNEEKTIAGVIRGVKDLGGEYHVIVINDCSVDNTTERAEREGATVIELPFNLGIGGAVQTGYKYALLHGFDACVQVDGDGQHPPYQIPKLIEPLFADSFDLVVGSRFLGGNYRVPFMRALGIRLISLFLRAVRGPSIKDTTSGFRASNRQAMALFSKHYPQDYPEPEALLIAHLTKLRVAEVSVEMSYREHGSSSITPLRSAYYMTKVLIAMFIDLFKKY